MVLSRTTNSGWNSTWRGESFGSLASAIGENQWFVLEYKFFEPAFYHTDVPDWGTSLGFCDVGRCAAGWSSNER
ncbi:MAG: hypothetical protein EPN48_04880 [Microbacteriaceae bacterium]|nr:MAG: hypothetical protein EPN48_04880 [Microbacteriaceae bacterium]